MDRSRVLPAALFLGLLMMKVGWTSSSCSSAQDCTACVSSGSNCVWCSQRTANITPSCIDRAVANISCNLSYIQDPQVAITNVVQENLSESVLISPQYVGLNLRTGQQASFNVSVRTSRMYPLDFYFMMDLTQSLSNDIATVRDNGIAIVNLLKNISQNYKVGFGSFVDKPVPPFVANVPYIQPNGMCYNGATSCIEPYAYRHILTMTNVTDDFLYILNHKLNISAAAENPQSGADGLAQALLCKEIIGWREEAFRMLMLITDNACHFAGDGKEGGVVVPFDGQCHLEWNSAFNTSDYMAKYSTLYDFPSVAQLKSLIATSGVSVIFGIAGSSPRDVVYFPNVYKALATIMGIEESSVATLDTNSTNLLQVINQQYLQAIGRIKFSVPVLNGVTVTVEPILGCNRSVPNGCEDVSLETEVVFNVTVSLLQCPSIPQNISIVLSIPALAQQLTVVINPNCRCPCESKPEANSSLCNNQTLVCGQCQCGAGKYGKSCECSGVMACPVGFQGMVCSGESAGTCQPDNCYRCQCKGNYFGNACECDSTKCLLTSSGICSGAANGVCSCSDSNYTCNCKEAPLSNITYKGSVCNCDPDECVNRDTNITCSDPTIGSTLCSCSGSPCQCSCTCPSGTVPPLCEPKPLVDMRCSTAKPCATCGATKPQSECVGCVFITNANQAYRCDVISPNSCTDSYTYYVDTQNRVYLMRNIVQCDPGPTPVIIIFSILGAIIALGLIFLIVAKIILICMDQIEYKKFTSQLEGADWAPRSNPLYMSPEQNYTNVLYRKRSYRGNK